MPARDAIERINRRLGVADLNQRLTLANYLWMALGVLFLQQEFWVCFFWFRFSPGVSSRAVQPTALRPRAASEVIHPSPKRPRVRVLPSGCFRAPLSRSIEQETKVVNCTWDLLGSVCCIRIRAISCVFCGIQQYPPRSAPPTLRRCTKITLCFFARRQLEFTVPTRASAREYALLAVHRVCSSMHLERSGRAWGRRTRPRKCALAHHEPG